MKIGVYLCECGGNISNVVDLQEVAAFAREQPDVVMLHQFHHMCSGAGQKLILKDIEEHNLDKIVVAACSPHFHEKTFKATLEKGGLNSYVLEMANFREHSSWAHRNEPEIATQIAKDLVKIAIDKVRLDVPLEKRMMPLGNRVLVIGGGIAGIQASLDLADAGKQVVLVEKEPTIGGKMALLSKTFPTEDCAACILSPKMVDVQNHPNITLLANSEIERIDGHRLHFETTVTITPRYISETIDMDECLTCGVCVEKCPVEVPDPFEQYLLPRKAIYIPSGVAIPYKYTVDNASCLHLTQGECGICAEVCPQKVIDFTQQPEKRDVSVDAIVVATGYDIYDAAEKKVFGYGEAENIVNGLEMERIIDHIADETPLRPIGRRVAFIQCVGSRDEQIGREYCSRICCMYATKLASLLKQAEPDKDVYIFYTDLRAYGKGFEEYYKKAQKMGIKYIRGKPAEIFENAKTKKVTILVEDTLSRQMIESEFDLVVLSTGMEISKSTNKIAEFLKLAKSPDGFLQEAHPKYKPVDTLVEGVFIAGAVQGPKDIPDTVTQASAAAARVIGTLAKEEFEIDPLLAFVHEDRCDGCQLCLDVCPLHAIKLSSLDKAEINDALCVGCGACIASCPKEALDLYGYTSAQLYAETRAALDSKKGGERRILMFADNSCSYRLVDTVGVRKLGYTGKIRILRVPGSGRVTPKLLLYALAEGADGIIIGDCPAKSSLHPWNIDFTKDNISKVQKILRDEHIDADRMLFSEFETTMLSEFVSTINGLAERIQQLPAISDEQRTRLRGAAP